MSFSQSTLVIATIVWSLCLRPTPCMGQCDTRGFLVCNVHLLNMTSDGAVRLRRIIDSGDMSFVTVNIAKLIVSESASGPFLARIGAFTDAVSYLQYRDAVFQLPTASTLTDIFINGNGALRTFIAGRNVDMRQLHVDNCLLDRIPPTLSQMVNLDHLVINRCLLSGLRLDAFSQNRELRSIDLSYNMIRQLVPMTTPVVLPILEVYLVSNLLERLDFSTFASMPQLERIDLQRNNIVQVEASATVSFPNLRQLYLSFNKIASIELGRLTLPIIRSLELDNNALVDVPSRWGNLPNLTTLSVSRNKLKQLELSAVSSLAGVSLLFFDNNEIETVLLQGIRIASVNASACNFRNVQLLAIDNNRLTAVPPIFRCLPNARLVVDANPLKCNSIVPFMSRFTDRRLFVSNAWRDEPCYTTSSIPLNEIQKACCDN